MEVPHKSSDLPTGRNGHGALKEIMRRLCFVEKYHTKGWPSVSFYHYVEIFDRNKCFSNDTVTRCSMDAMIEVGAHHSKLEDCLQEDLIDEDIASDVMEKNLRHLGQKTLQEMPQIHIDGEPILEDDDNGDRKHFDAKTVFQSYCDAFHASDRLKDLLACEICLPCKDVRTCLWNLTCDGEAIYKESAATLPPAATNEEKKDSSTSNSNNSNSNNDSSPSSSGPNVAIVILLCLVIAAGVCVGAYYVFRDIRTRQRMSEIDKTLTFSTSDDSPEVNGYTDSDPGSGASETKSVDLVDFVLADGSQADQFKDANQFEASGSKQPNDTLDEESEWVENKRLSPDAHIC